MKLSTAISLGATLKMRDPLRFLSYDKSCGCAIGGAILAAGIADKFQAERASHVYDTPLRRLTELPSIISTWPWLTEDHVLDIGRLYREEDTEQVLEYVKSVEPADTDIIVTDTQQELAQLPTGAHDAWLDSMAGTRGGGE